MGKGRCRDGWTFPCRTDLCPQLTPSTISPKTGGKAWNCRTRRTVELSATGLGGDVMAATPQAQATEEETVHQNQDLRASQDPIAGVKRQPDERPPSFLACGVPPGPGPIAAPPGALSYAPRRRPSVCHGL